MLMKLQRDDIIIRDMPVVVNSKQFGRLEDVDYVKATAKVKVSGRVKWYRFDELEHLGFDIGDKVTCGDVIGDISDIDNGDEFCRDANKVYLMVMWREPDGTMDYENGEVDYFEVDTADEQLDLVK